MLDNCPKALHTLTHVTDIITVESFFHGFVHIFKGNWSLKRFHNLYKVTKPVRGRDKIRVCLQDLNHIVIVKFVCSLSSEFMQVPCNLHTFVNS